MFLEKSYLLIITKYFGIARAKFRKKRWEFAPARGNIIKKNITLIFDGGESTGHVILGLLTVVLVLVQSHQAYWKFYRR